MSDTATVACPNCDSSFRVSRDQDGRRGKCPKCKQPVVIAVRYSDPVAQEFSAFATSPPPPLPTTPLQTETPQTKQCPFCAETIQLAALKCRFCDEFLDGRQAPEMATHPPSSPPPRRMLSSTVLLIVGYVLLAIAAAYILAQISKAFGTRNPRDEIDGWMPWIQKVLIERGVPE